MRGWGGGWAVAWGTWREAGVTGAHGKFSFWGYPVVLNIFRGTTGLLVKGLGGGFGRGGGEVAGVESLGSGGEGHFLWGVKREEGLGGSACWGWLGGSWGRWG